MDAYRSDEDIIQNLKASGCDEAAILAFMDNLHSGKQEKGARLLAQHRRSLLDKLHTEQKKTECLDYLLFVLRKEGYL